MEFFKKLIKKYVINFQKALKNNQGFSLVEILVALTLLGLVGTFVAGKIFEQLHEGNVKATKIQMGQFAQRLQEFRRKCNFYPSTEQGLDSLVAKPTVGRDCKNYPSSGFIEGGEIPLDPWDGEYIYVNDDGRNFNIISYGSDGLEGGEDQDADIYFKEQRNSEEQ